jgi:transposase
MIQIPAVIERCAGIDVGKREIAVAIITGPADQDGEVKTRAFATTVPALEELREWLIQEGCCSVAMESTGSYWIPVKNILEASVRIVLVCPRNHRPERGDKTDFRDAKNLAHLHRHGLAQGKLSFAALYGRIAGSDAAPQEVARQPDCGEESHPEGAGGGQCQDR